LQRDRYTGSAGADDAQITLQLRVGRKLSRVCYHSPIPGGSKAKSVFLEFFRDGIALDVPGRRYRRASSGINGDKLHPRWSGASREAMVGCLSGPENSLLCLLQGTPLPLRQ